jgi:16S rRNA (guanine527-N7)-methyltransferase
MPTLPEVRIATLLAPYLSNTSVPETLYAQLSTYLDLLLKWNARTNLTAIRDPEEIVQRHFGESLFTGIHLGSRLTAPSLSSTLAPLSPALLDLGSGAGFPGLPIQLLYPALKVTLAESQNKKSTFLREVVRTLNLPTEIWAARAETLPPSRLFDIVTLRAVDNMAHALVAAKPRLTPNGLLAILITEPSPTSVTIPLPAPSHGYLTLISASQ